MLIGAFIALSHFLNVDNLDRAIPVEQDTVVADAKPVAVFVMRQRLDVLAIRHRRQCADGVTDSDLVRTIELPQLLRRLECPVDFVH